MQVQMSLFTVFASVVAVLVVVVQAAPRDLLPEPLHKTHHHAAKKEMGSPAPHPFSFEGSDDPYVNYDPEIGAYIECDALEKGKRITKKCPLSEEASMGTGPIRLACQTAFSVERGILHQGCWAHQGEYVEETCTIGTCGSNTRHGDVHFCCCRGSLCNRDYYVRPEIEDAPTADFTDLN